MRIASRHLVRFFGFTDASRRNSEQWGSTCMAGNLPRVHVLILYPAFCILHSAVCILHRVSFMRADCHILYKKTVGEYLETVSRPLSHIHLHPQPFHFQVQSQFKFQFRLNSTPIPPFHSFPPPHQPDVFEIPNGPGPKPLAANMTSHHPCSVARTFSTLFRAIQCTHTVYEVYAMYAVAGSIVK